jgi:methyltransferase-like protein/2-polyprenyl-3-methyl-5-hydroxy-6-metoxy-1,4-benzoquinol methylase
MAETRPTEHAPDLDDAIEQLRAVYDETPYTSNSFPQSAPGRLAAIAHLFGLDAPDAGSARVLEIGCATGGNLIPFAAYHPDAHAVGIDLSEVQIEAGRTRVQALGLDNVELLAGDIARMELTELGQFDFIVAHGVYSWVPPDVQEAILAAIQLLLAPDGVAYLSYNTYPGWKSKEVVRDAMLLASGASGSADAKVRDAREMADFLEAAAPADSVLAKVLEVSREHALGFGGSFLLHDELAAFNAPCYFYEFVGRAGAHGLSFLAEAHPETMFPGNFGPQVAEFLAAKCGGVQVLVEQYLDFVLNRMFRETLLVHTAHAAQLRHEPERGRYRRLHVAASVPPVGEPTRLDHSRQEYVVSDATLFTNDPGLKATLDALTERWPWTLSRDELVAAVRTRFDDAGLVASADMADHVDELIGVLIKQGTAEFRLDPVLPASAAGALRIDRVVRRMVELTRDSEDATTFNRWHETLPVTPLDRHLLPLLDGTRDRDALVRDLLASVRSDPAGLDTEPLPDDELQAAVSQYVDDTPRQLVELKLLRVE